MAQTITGLFGSLSEAQSAVEDLVGVGFTREQIGLIGAHGNVPTEAQAGSNVATGAEAGAVVGGAAGFLLAAVLLTVPGIGPILAAGTLAGIGIGAVAGGVIGALVHSGVPQNLAQSYAEGIGRGGAVVTVQTPDERVAEVSALFTKHGASETDSDELTPEALQRAKAELATIEPSGTVQLHFGDEGAKSQLSEDPISEVAPFRESRP